MIATDEVIYPVKTAIEEFCGFGRERRGRSGWGGGLGE
jgi:hypothetical protein